MSLETQHCVSTPAARGAVSNPHVVPAGPINLACLHCRTEPFEFVRVAPGEKPRNYMDSPAIAATPGSSTATHRADEAPVSFVFPSQFLLLAVADFRFLQRYCIMDRAKC